MGGTVAKKVVRKMPASSTRAAPLAKSPEEEAEKQNAGPAHRAPTPAIRPNTRTNRQKIHKYQENAKRA